MITKLRNVFIQFSKIGYFTALKYSMFFSNQWSSIDLFYQRSKPLDINLHQYHFEHFDGVKTKDLSKNYKEIYDQKLLIKSHYFKLRGALHFLSLLLNELSYSALLRLEIKFFSSAN